MTFQIHLYNNLKLLRKSKGWKQEDMQAHCGISRATWSNYENGNTEPDIQSLVKIAAVFDISLDELILTELKDTSRRKKKKRPVTYELGSDAQTLANEPDSDFGQAILKELHEIQGKIDRLLDKEE
ncbi:MAG: helix-turn-helix domain-containing protein [Agriterribacter sp.]